MVPEIFAKSSWQIKSKSWKKNTGKRFREGIFAGRKLEGLLYESTS